MMHAEEMKYMYNGRVYKLKYVPIAEMWTLGGGWTKMPDDLTNQLVELIRAGRADHLDE